MLVKKILFNKPLNSLLNIKLVSLHIMMFTLLNKMILKHMKHVCVLPMVMSLVTINVLRIIALNSTLKLVSKCLSYFQTYLVPLKIPTILPNVVMLPYNSGLISYLISRSQMAIPSTLISNIYLVQAWKNA